MVVYAVKRYRVVAGFLCAFFLMMCGAGRLPAQDSVEETVPPGMEVRVFGQAKLMVPKDARVTEKGGMLVVEGIDLYVARTFNTLRARLEALEIRQQEMQGEIGDLYKKVSAGNTGSLPIPVEPVDEKSGQ
jgi:hypothetical protein